MSSSHYALLGLNPHHDPTEREATKAYRMLSLRYHPDKAPDDPIAGTKFCALSDAYEAIRSHIKARAAQLDIAETRRVADEAKAREEECKASRVAEIRRKWREAGRLEAERMKREKREREKVERVKLEKIAAERRENHGLAENRPSFQKTSSKLNDQSKAENRGFYGSGTSAGKGRKFPNLHSYSGTQTRSNCTCQEQSTARRRGKHYQGYGVEGVVYESKRRNTVVKIKFQHF